MILASQQTPSDLSKLNSGEMTDSVYKAYDVPTARYDRTYPAYSNNSPSNNSPNRGANQDAWGSNGAIIAGIDRNSAKTISGKVTDHKQVMLGKDIPAASAMTVKIDNAPDAVVLIGPAGKSEYKCKPGDIVTVDVYRTMVGGKEHWIARSYEVNGQRTTLIDGNNSPLWNDR